MVDELDQVRGVLSGLSYGLRPLLRPVSTNAIAASLKWRNRSFDVGSHLARLSSIGDVQRLPGGLWLPCCTTLVRCATVLVTVSGLPTSQLATELGEIPQAAGDSRFIVGSAIADSDIRLRDFRTWCRAPASSLSWAEDVIANAQYWQATLTEGMEWHDHWNSETRGRWRELFADVDLTRGAVLARIRARHGQAEYFLLRSHCGALQMAEISKVDGEHQRLRYALLAMAGNPASYRILRVADGFLEVSLPRVLPQPESMVLHALGRTAPDSQEWMPTFSLPHQAWPQLEQMLTGLGLIRSKAA